MNRIIEHGTFGVDRRTAKGIVKRCLYTKIICLHERRRGGRNYVVVDDEVGNLSMIQFDQDPVLSLQAYKSYASRKIVSKAATTATHNLRKNFG